MRYLFITFLFLAFSSFLYAYDATIVARDGVASCEYRIEDRGRFGHRLSVYRKTGDRYSLLSKVKIQHNVYQFAVDDINGDGVLDMLVGVIKRTRFDPIEKKRLFIYTMDKEHIRPLWLGSKVGTGLEDFRVITFKDAKSVLTIESDSFKTYSIRLYTFGSFGPVWRKNIVIRRSNKDEVRQNFLSYGQQIR